LTEKKKKKKQKPKKKNQTMSGEELPAGSKRPRTIAGYSNEDNPFGDSRLTDAFVWHKKRKALGLPTEDPDASDGVGGAGGANDPAQVQKIEAEVAKVKARREEAQQERLRMEAERREKERQGEALLAGGRDDAAREVTFFLGQLHRGARARLLAGRGTPCDRLAANLCVKEGHDWFGAGALAAVAMASSQGAHGGWGTDPPPYETDEPKDIIEAIEDDAEISEIATEAGRRAVLGDVGAKDYWPLVAAVCESVLAERTIAGGVLAPVHAKVRDDLRSVARSLAADELDALAARAKRVTADDPGADASYWTAVMQYARSEASRKRLRDAHVDYLEKRLEELEAYSASMAAARESAGDDAAAAAAGADDDEVEVAEPGGADARAPDWVPRDIAEEGAAEELLTADFDLGKQTLSWDDKYRPRKPRYFNRVRTGYEWNRYNRTHYTKENPPPKTVQGYKFNIFYPDLIDVTDTPSYHISKGKSPGTKIIRFHAGPPYEDVAFEVLDKEWDLSRRHGFRNSFDRGVLSLWFNFKRLRYRR
jgi:hypothetical protein